MLRRIRRRLRTLRTRPLSDEDIYSAEFRESLLEDGEISSEEAGFMQGYEGV